jgi:hypothetical protein
MHDARRENRLILSVFLPPSQVAIDVIYLFAPCTGRERKDSTAGGPLLISKLFLSNIQRKPKLRHLL